jgi:hypothetical protein
MKCAGSIRSGSEDCSEVLQPLVRKILLFICDPFYIWEMRIERSTDLLFAIDPSNLYL